MKHFDKPMLRGEFDYRDFTIFYEHCTGCKRTRCIIVSDRKNQEIDITCDYYPGYSNMSIRESLKRDMPEIISQYENTWR